MIQPSVFAKRSQQHFAPRRLKPFKAISLQKLGGGAYSPRQGRGRGASNCPDLDWVNQQSHAPDALMEQLSWWRDWKHRLAGSTRRSLAASQRCRAELNQSQLSHSLRRAGPGLPPVGLHTGLLLLLRASGEWDPVKVSSRSSQWEKAGCCHEEQKTQTDLLGAEAWKGAGWAVSCPCLAGSSRLRRGFPTFLLRTPAELIISPGSSGRRLSSLISLEIY